MIKIIGLLIALIALGCQNQNKKAEETAKEVIADTAVNEQVYITLGGEEQYVEITSSSSKNPVLLFLHGGPGWPQTPHLRYFNADLTKGVTLVSWDQAGCGKSYIKNPDPKNLSLEKLISDAHELTQILKKKFHQEKIYLAGFSWGSVIGLHLAQRYPEDYAAYFGISQVIDMKRSIELSREWLKNEATKRGDKKMLADIKRLERADTSLCKSTLECFFKKYEFLTAYGGAIHSPKSESEIKIAETKYADYQNYDWLNAFMFSCSKLGDAIFETNLTGVNNLKIPAYFFVGRHDWSLPTVVTTDFVEKLQAPKKEMVWFENSGHEPLEEEPAKFNETVVERIRLNK